MSPTTLNNARHSNRLRFEKSPYLLQHADNPVNWYPWGEEAFHRAHTENKPVFLSIGYSTCHWCHVMAHESFEDEVVAQLLNDVFVSIKVDREERPDIDHLYMTVCQMLTGSGGWPLTIMMTPAKKPFFAGTYFPKTTRFGRIGMTDLIPKIAELWQTRQAEVVNSAEQITSELRKAATQPARGLFTEQVLHQAFHDLKQRFDPVYGGFGEAPKFPTPHNLTFLLRYWYETKNESALQMVETTLQAMRNGGIYDHIGFGFHRYSTDRQWLVPHFEKMLYDQALLVLAYLEAYQITHHSEYARTASEILTYVQRDLTDSLGGFYSAEDADSEGEEGKFYLWTTDEIQAILGTEEADFMIRLFNLTSAGNYQEQATAERTGKNILFLQKSAKALAAALGLSEKLLLEKLSRNRQQLFAARETRIHPHKDDKILTDWNGLMIAALAKAAQVLSNPDYARAASRATEFILKHLRKPDGRLLHRFREGQADIQAQLDDYAFFIRGLLELYETDFNTRYLRIALELNELVIRDFRDESAGGFFFTAQHTDDLIVRQKLIYDGAIPSGNSVMLLNLLRLGRMTANPHYEALAEQLGEAFAQTVKTSPAAYTQLLSGLCFTTGPNYEVVVAGNPAAADTQMLLKALQQQFLPNKVVLLRPDDSNAADITQIAEFTKNQRSLNGRATAYVCQRFQCQAPTTEVERMLALVSSGS